MKKRIAITLAAAAVAVVATGCGSSSNDSGSTSSSGGGGGKAAAKTTSTSMKGMKNGMKGMKGMAGMVAVTMKNIQFSPANVTAKVGQTVMWTNQDAVGHDVTKTGGPGKKFSSGTGNLNKGDTYSVKLTAPGKVTYVCTVHPGMKGTITVK